MDASKQPIAGLNRFNSIFFKLIAIVGVVSAAVGIILTYLSFSTSHRIVEDTMIRKAAEITEFTAKSVNGAFQMNNARGIELRVDTLLNDPTSGATYGFAMKHTGDVYLDKGSDASQAGALLSLSQMAVETGEIQVAEGGLSVAVPISGQNGAKIYGALALGWTSDHLHAAARKDQVDALAWSGGALLVALLLTSALIWRSVVSPLTRLSRAIDELARDNFDVEIPCDGRGDELGTIGNSLRVFSAALKSGAAQAFENQFRGTALNESASSVLMTKMDMTIWSMNRSLATRFGEIWQKMEGVADDANIETLVGHPLQKMLPADLQDLFTDIPERHADLPLTKFLSIGEVRFEVTVNLVKTADGDEVGYVMEWNDVTKDHLNRAILDSIEANQIKIDFDVSGTFLSANPLFVKTAGLDLDAFLGRHANSIFAFDPAKEQENGAVFDQLARGDSVYGRFRIPRPDQQDIVIDGGFVAVQDRNGMLIRIVLIGNDVTAIQQEIEAAQVQREKMERAQSAVVDALRVGLGKLSEGDLTSRIDVVFDAEYEQLRSDYNETAENLAIAMCGVAENADLIQGEAIEISSAADDLSQRTERQAATLEETATALDELTTSVSNAAEGASHASEVVQTARKNAEISGQVVNEAVGAMSEIERSSRQISKITSVIDDIAFQTNLLALNAGVEAARAGEAGRGFAVVASEVRALAQRSAEAASEINGLISKSGTHVSRGVALVAEAGDALTDIVESVNEISRNVQDNALAAREQSSGLADINAAINQLDQVTQQNAAMFEETTAATHALTREADALNETLKQFVIDGGRPGSDDGEIVDLQSADASHEREDLRTESKESLGESGVSSLISADRRMMPSSSALPAAFDDDDEDWEDF